MEDAHKARVELKRALLSAHIALQLAEVHVIQRLHKEDMTEEVAVIGPGPGCLWLGEGLLVSMTS